MPFLGARRLAAAAVSQSKPAGLTEQQPTQQKQQQLQPMVGNRRRLSAPQ